VIQVVAALEDWRRERRRRRKRGEERETSPISAAVEDSREGEVSSCGEKEEMVESGSEQEEEAVGDANAKERELVPTQVPD